MAFSMAFVPRGGSEDDHAQIELGDFSESFDVPTHYWRPQDYRRQWAAAIRRLVTEGAETTLLIAEMYEPSTANFLVAWPMYRDGDVVHVQNVVLFVDQLAARFDERDPYASTPVRETVSDDGDRISEWTVSVDDLRQWYESAAHE